MQLYRYGTIQCKCVCSMNTDPFFAMNCYKTTLSRTYYGLTQNEGIEGSPTMGAAVGWWVASSSRTSGSASRDRGSGFTRRRRRRCGGRAGSAGRPNKSAATSPPWPPTPPPVRHSSSWSWGHGSEDHAGAVPAPPSPSNRHTGYHRRVSLRVLRDSCGSRPCPATAADGCESSAACATSRIDATHSSCVAPTSRRRPPLFFRLGGDQSLGHGGCFLYRVVSGSIIQEH